MADNSIPHIGPTAKVEPLTRETHRINGVNELNDPHLDAAYSAIEQIHALACAFTDENFTELNPQIHAAAMRSISFMAAQAHFSILKSGRDND